jgi:diguanylate cyclase (GGDEF)-like protein
VTETLLNADDTVFEECFQSCLEIIAHTIGLARVYIYKCHLVEGASCCTEIYEWAEGVEATLGEDFTVDVPLDAWPGLEEFLSAGKNYNKLIKDTPGEIQAMIPRGIGAVLYAPIFLKDLLWGFVGYERVEERSFSEEEEAILGSVSLLLANSLIRYDLNKNLYLAVDKINTTAVKAEILEKFAYTDALTGLYNRRHFMELAQTVLEKAKRFDTVSYAMIMDLDFFKKVNDTYGHLAGDEVLKNAALVMKNTLRSYDLLARYGGEEFVVLISETGKEDVLNLAERIRESIAATPCVYNCIKIPCTVSIGVAATFPDCTIESLIDRADKGLYQAKESGRNQVILFKN